MKMADKIFIDTNILIYLVDKASRFHEKALKKNSELSDNNSEFWISRQVIREYSVITTRQGLIINPLSTEMLIEDIKKFEEIYNIADETQQTTNNLIKLIQKYNIIRKKNSRYKYCCFNDRILHSGNFHLQ